MQTDMLPWFSILSLLAYIPLVCYLDWKYRDIGTHKIWLPLIAWNIPVVAAGYLTGYYPQEIFLATVLMSVGWFAILRNKGADCVWLILITMFAVVNPVSGVAIIYPFVMYLFIFTLAVIFGVYLDNRLQKGKWVFETERGIPYLIVISLAFVMAVVMG